MKKILNRKLRTNKSSAFYLGFALVLCVAFVLQVAYIVADRSAPGGIRSCQNMSEQDLQLHYINSGTYTINCGSYKPFYAWLIITAIFIAIFYLISEKMRGNLVRNEHFKLSIPYLVAWFAFFFVIAVVYFVYGFFTLKLSF